MTRPGFVTAVLVSLCLAGCGVFNSPARQMQRSEDALARGEYNEAAVILRTLAEKEPERGDVWLLLARTLHQLGDVDGADRTLQLAIENGAPEGEVSVFQMEQGLAAGKFEAVLDIVNDAPTPIDSYQRRYYRARALQGLRRTPEALVLYKALAQEKDSPDLQVRIAQCHAFHGRDELMNEALARAPDRAEGWVLKWNHAQRNNDHATAREALGKAIETAPGQLTAVQQSQLVLAGVDQALRAGDQARAEQYRGVLVKLLPQAPITQLVSAQVRLHGSAASEVVSELQRLLQAQPEYQAARAQLIVALLRTGALELALKEASTLATARPDDPAPRQTVAAVRAAAAQPAGSTGRDIAIANAFNELQQPALARASLQSALQKEPDNKAARTALIQVETAAGRTDEALQLARDLAEAHPGEAAPRALIAIAQEAAGDHAAAAETYESLWKENPTGQITLTLAHVRRRAGLPVVDMPLRQWLARNPRDGQIRLELAVAMQQSGDPAGAVRELEQVVPSIPADHPARPIALNNLAVAYGLAGNPRALETARTAYELAKTASSTQDTYGWLLVQAGRVSEGLPLLQSASEANPRSPEVRYHYAAALARSGQQQEAKVLLADVLLDDQQFEGRSDAERLLATL